MGTPAQDVRKVKLGEGRMEGNEQEKRTVKPVIFKSNKEKKVASSEEQNLISNSICGFEKTADIPKLKNKEIPIDVLKSWLPGFNLSVDDLAFLSAKEQPTLKEHQIR